MVLILGNFVKDITNPLRYIVTYIYRVNNTKQFFACFTNSKFIPRTDYIISLPQQQQSQCHHVHTTGEHVIASSLSLCRRISVEQFNDDISFTNDYNMA